LEAVPSLLFFKEDEEALPTGSSRDVPKTRNFERRSSLRNYPRWLSFAVYDNAPSPFSPMMQENKYE
jgi:hypothetical protein